MAFDELARGVEAGQQHQICQLLLTAVDALGADLVVRGGRDGRDASATSSTRV
jgi:hypothetical protein